MPATHTANLGLNKPDRQDLVSVVTDINDNMDTLDGAIGALPTGRTLQGQINALKPIAITLDPVTSANGAVTVTTTDARVTEDMKAVFLEVGTPETFKAPIRITTGNGSVELYCANAVGSSTVVVTLEMATPLDSADPQPASVTSTEFDILAGRIGTLSSLNTSVKTDIVSAINSLNSKILLVQTSVTISQGVDYKSVASQSGYVLVGASRNTNVGDSWSTWNGVVMGIIESSDGSGINLIFNKVAPTGGTTIGLNLLFCKI